MQSIRDQEQSGELHHKSLSEISEAASLVNCASLNEYKIEICIALKPYQNNDADMLQFKKGEKILIDRSVKGPTA